MCFMEKEIPMEDDGRKYDTKIVVIIMIVLHLLTNYTHRI